MGLFHPLTLSPAHPLMLFHPLIGLAQQAFDLRACLGGLGACSIHEEPLAGAASGPAAVLDRLDPSQDEFSEWLSDSERKHKTASERFAGSVHPSCPRACVPSCLS